MIAVEAIRRNEKGHAVAAKGQRKRGKRRADISCEQCYFGCNGLCALDLGEPCATFRPNRPEGLVPPRQPALLVREPALGEPLERAA